MRKLQKYFAFYVISVILLINLLGFPTEPIYITVYAPLNFQSLIVGSKLSVEFVAVKRSHLISES